MSINEILKTTGGAVGVLLLLVQISPIKINPFGWILGILKKALQHLGSIANSQVLDELEGVKKGNEETSKKLEEHIRNYEERNADLHRSRILRFNHELVRGIGHTEEDWVEILSEIDKYEDYCTNHKEYENNRAIHAISNIERSYDIVLQTGDFL